MTTFYGKQVIYGHFLISMFQLAMAITLNWVFENQPVSLALLFGATVSILLFAYTSSNDHRERMRAIIEGEG